MAGRLPRRPADLRREKGAACCTRPPIYLFTQKFLQRAAVVGGFIFIPILFAVTSVGPVVRKHGSGFGIDKAKKDGPMSYDDQNVFAKILRRELPAAIVYEDERTAAFMDIMPRSDGHCLVIPKAPARNLLDCDEADLAACMAVVKKLSAAVMKAFDAEGITLLQANESAAGQEVFHLHFHIIPRHAGEKLKPPASEMEKPDVLMTNADRIIAAME